VKREHFKCIYQRNPQDIATNPDAAKSIYDAACQKFGIDRVRMDSYRQKGSSPDFPVYARDGRVISSHTISDTLSRLPVVAADYIFIESNMRFEAESWLKERRNDIIRIAELEVDDETPET
jgi:hypothetical protein